ncbi:MAG: DUF2523 domain-containing protein [Acidiferrobacterales bacterium]|nr:DUF2523 domain-containing protein [Acidiferrobacterales bacterium]
MGKLLAKFFGTYLSKIVYRVMGALGLGVIAFVGLEELKQLIFDRINQGLGGIGSEAIGLIAMAGVDHYITLIVSAYFSVFTVRQATKFIGVK